MAPQDSPRGCASACDATAVPLEGSEEWSAEIKEAARAAAVFYRDLLDQGLPEDVARDLAKAFVQSHWAKLKFEDDNDDWSKR